MGWLSDHVFNTHGLQRAVGKILPIAGTVATGGLGGGLLGGTLGKILPWALGAKQLYDTYSADREADAQAKYYDNLLRNGPTPYQFSPTERATYKSAADQDLSTAADQRRSSILSTLGRRGMLDSSLAPSMLTGLANWQDQQRTAADVAMQNDAYNRGTNTWQTQLQGAQFGVNNAQQNAAAGGSSLAQTLANLGKVGAYATPESTAPVSNDSWTPDTSGWDKITIGPKAVPLGGIGQDMQGLNVFGKKTGLQKRITPNLYG